MPGHGDATGGLIFCLLPSRRGEKGEGDGMWGLARIINKRKVGKYEWWRSSGPVEGLYMSLRNSNTDKADGPKTMIR